MTSSEVVHHNNDFSYKSSRTFNFSRRKESYISLAALDEFIPTLKVVVTLTHLLLLGDLATTKIKMKNNKKEK